LLIVALGQLHDLAAGLLEQLLAVGVRGHHGTVARQGQAQRLGQAVHRVGGEHARAGTAGRTGRAFDLGQVGLRHLVIGGHHHGVDQVEFLDLDGFGLRIGQAHAASFHRAAGDEYHRNVQAHRGHQHAGRDLVAVGNAHQRVGAVGVDHVFDRVGNHIAAGQRIQHAVMAHGNAVIHSNGVELLGYTTRSFDLPRHQLTQVLEVHMSRHELGERVGDRNDRFAEVLVLHARGAPQRTGTRHVAAGGGGLGTVSGHVYSETGHR